MTFESGIKKDKAFLRREKLKERKALKESELLCINKGVAENVRSLHQYKNAEAVYFYMAAGNEVSLLELFDECVRNGKTCVFPRVINEFQMEFFIVEGMEQLIEGYRGILEPDGKCPLYEYDGKRAVMLVPAAVFDRNGGRIGMGKGFYDRYISSHNIGCLIGICGEYQLADKVPMDKHDRYMDIVVTEKAVYRGMEDSE